MKCKKCRREFVLNARRLVHEKKCVGVVRCLSCKDQIIILRNNTFHKYCSNQCQANYEWLILKKKIKANKKVHTARIKDYLIEVKGYRCSICKKRKWRGQPIPLILDHKDGNPNHDRLKNMRLVCGNCDMQLPTYKNKNRGNGRAYRRERYAQGKSY